MGGRAIWTVPVAFVSAMAVGALIGIAGIEAPLVEYGITGSVLILGLGILINRSETADSSAQGWKGWIGLPEWAAIAIVSIFAFFHGNAHGTELPALSDTFGLIVAYIAGFLIATIGLHVIGALIGIMASRSSSGKMVMRITGGIIAAIGVFLIMGV